MKTKYIFVTGGVLSGLGKGVTAASIGNILKSHGFKIWMQKFDQYLNVDAGTLNPEEHGEVFVLDDGSETDLDLGHYERFIDTSLNKTSSIMSGQIYQAILEKERSGKYLGKTIQMIPHVTDEVKSRIFKAAEDSKCDFLITEIGGTIGDYEGTHFVEAIRQMKHDAGENNVLYVHVGFLPYLGASCELKGRPMQFSVHDLQAMGIQPDVLICRSDHPVKPSMIKKIALFTGVEEEAVIPLETVDTIYRVPLILEKYHLDQIISRKLKFHSKKQNNKKWQDFIQKIDPPAGGPKKKTIKIGLVGKYMGMKDTYFSITESLKTAAVWQNVKLELGWIDAEELEKSSKPEILKIMKEYSAICVPGGFGSRGIEGKILAIKYAREHKIPFLGLCYGMQLATIEFARNVANLKNANSTEIDPKTPHSVIHIMPEQEKKLLENNYGGSMRLGAYPCKLNKNSKTYNCYKLQSHPERSEGSLANARSKTSLEILRLTPQNDIISERHRHRYEFNNEYREILEQKGLVISGTSPDNRLVEIIELKNHPFFIATQFHPEFKSRPLSPHPLFMEFVKTAGHITK
ncbi:MAG: CTP synthase [Berkelbacteria bacterium GW2011_GWA1_36_9]|uniref:CTP synthase n=1 Tax=Berkelbacteria bacterium GW2011_GWA1_36_9 TaxID=1618331 RepID=A0A0G0IRS3_9BACT|nr:MAG: CTP synthase [Berkelbacteria bacterium GW2011_GWA1_36_9]